MGDFRGFAPKRRKSSDRGAELEVRCVCPRVKRFGMEVKMIELHGGDIYRNHVEYDFSVNVNPLGMPEGSVRAAQEAILHSARYPDWRGEALCRAIAEAEGVEAEWILPGSGAAELIYGICAAVRGCGAERHGRGPSGGAAAFTGMMSAPSFQEYEAAVNAAGGEALFWNLSGKEGFVLTEGILGMIEEEKPDVLFLCNPANPTGLLTGKNLLLQIIETCERTGTWFCLDECFLPFLEQEGALSLKRECAGYPHLIVLRAFTKIYGMPGLRLGYAVSANASFRERLRRCLPPWNTSLPAQMAGIAALSDRAYLKRTRVLIEEEKRRLMEAMEEGLAEQIIGHAANFLFFRGRRDLKERMLEQGILIRSCADFRNLGEGYFRIGIRTREENEELLRRWRAMEGKCTAAAKG